MGILWYLAHSDMEGKNEEPGSVPADKFGCRKLSMEFADLPSFCYTGFCTDRTRGPVNKVSRQFDYAADVA